MPKGKVLKPGCDRAPREAVAACGVEEKNCRRAKAEDGIQSRSEKSRCLQRMRFPGGTVEGLG